MRDAIRAPRRPAHRNSRRGQCSRLLWASAAKFGGGGGHAALLAAIGALAAVLVLLRVSEWGPAVWSDSLEYVHSADSLLAGSLAGFVRDSYGRPPLFPLAMAGIGLFGPNPLDAAAGINAAAFGLTAFATAAWVRSRTGSGFLAVWTGLACALCLPLARFAAAALTEALFVLFAVLSLYALDRWLDGRRTSLLLAAAACAALACATRYLGLALVMGMLPVALLADGRGIRPTRRGIAAATLIAAGALTPICAWMLSLLTYGSSAGGFIVPTGWDTSSALYLLAGEVSRGWRWARAASRSSASARRPTHWAPPPCSPSRAARRPRCPAANGGGSRSPPRSWRPTRPAVLFTNWYLDFDLVTRYLVPLYPPLLAAAAIMLGALLRRASEHGPFVRLPLPGRAAAMSSAPALALAAILVLWLPQQLDASLGDIREWRSEGWEFTARRWAESDTARYLRAHPPEGPVWSNHNPTLILFGGVREPRILPTSARLAAARAYGADGWIVWFHAGFERGEYGIADLTAQPGIEAVAILKDGVVFRAADPAAPRASLAARLTGSARLLASSRFDVHLDEARNRLVYVRADCAAGDTGASFFLRAYPVDAGARPSGSGNLGFAFGEHGFREDGRCIAVRNLPGHPVAGVATGQWTPERGELWSVRVPVLGRPEVAAIDIEALRSRAAHIASGAPFEVWRDGRRLVYVREVCAIGDLAARFFLHVVPRDPDELPEDRRESGFDNLDFAFDEAGVLDGRCVAVRELPAYPVASIRTGQWVRGEGETWAVKAAFGE